MLTQQPLSGFLDDVASRTPAPGGGSVAALSGALGAALTSMVCNLTIGKKSYAGVEAEMQRLLADAERLRSQFTTLIDRDTLAFGKVMEAYALPRESADQKALRNAAIQGATKEAALVPLEVMKHTVDALALARTAADKGNTNSASDAGVSALMLHAACEAAALNVLINLNTIEDTDFVGWRRDEVHSLLKTARSSSEEVLGLVRTKLADI
jgi:formiminotetrahydrofolate cyclodeaminase